MEDFQEEENNNEILIDENGFLIEYEKEYNEYLPKFKEMQEQKKKKWEKFLSSNTITPNSKKLKNLIRDGIPSEHRGKIWCICLNTQELIDQNKGKYGSLIDESKRLIEIPLAIKQIEMDIDRTFPGHK